MDIEMEQDVRMNTDGIEKIEDKELKAKFEDEAKQNLSDLIELQKAVIAKKELMIKLYNEDCSIAKEVSFTFEKNPYYLEAVQKEVLITWNMELRKEYLQLKAYETEFADKYGDE